jgi:hypothetical protein
MAGLSDAVAAGDVAGHQHEEAEAEADEQEVEHRDASWIAEAGKLVAPAVKAPCAKPAPA